MDRSQNRFRWVFALGWGWSAGILFWWLFFFWGEPAEGLRGLPQFLAMVGLIQGLLMLPGAAVFWLWQVFVPRSRSNWSTAIPLGLLTGPLTIAAIHFVTEPTESLLQQELWLVSATTLPVSLTTFLAGAWYRRPAATPGIANTLQAP